MLGRARQVLKPVVVVLWFGVAAVAPDQYKIQAILIGAIAYAVYSGLLRLWQRQRNAWLQENYLDLLQQSRSEAPVFLYLRSFKTGRANDILDIFELDLADALQARGVFLAIGDRERSYGAAKLNVGDEQWKEEALRLIDRAEIIFFHPGPTESALWEMGQIVSRPEYLAKTLWIAPQEPPAWLAFKARRRVRSAWQAVREFVAVNFGMRFPPHADGKIFSVEGGQHGALFTRRRFLRAVGRNLKLTQPFSQEKLLPSVLKELEQGRTLLRAAR